MKKDYVEIHKLMEEIKKEVLKTTVLPSESFKNSDEDYKMPNNMKTEFFKKGQKVYDIRYGWGIVSLVVPGGGYQVLVEFEDPDEDHDESYTFDGKSQTDDDFPLLSHTEYTFSGFTQNVVSDKADKQEIITQLKELIEKLNSLT